MLSVAVREVYLGVLRGYERNFVPMLLSLIGMVVVRQIFLSLTMNVESPAIENIYYIARKRRQPILAGAAFA